MVHVKWVKSEMTGGGCTTYYGKLNNGFYFAMGNGAIMILNENYGKTLTKKFFKMSGGDTYEWERAHGKLTWQSADEVAECDKQTVKTLVTESFAKLGEDIASDFLEYVA